MTLVDFKQTIATRCKELLHEKINALKLIMSEIDESAEAESKSTAGDKHETGRAMMQLEQEKLNKQLAELGEQLSDFEKIDFEKTFNVASTGSLIETDKGCFFITTAIGKLLIAEHTVFVISLQSPLGNAFKGHTQNDTIVFNQNAYKILAIV